MHLRYKFDTDRKVRYRSRTETCSRARDSEKGQELGSQKAAWDVEATQRVLVLEEGGRAHILFHSMPLSIPAEALMMGVPNKNQVVYVLMHEKGTIIEASGMGFQGIVTFPDRDLSAGDSWTETTEVEFPMLPQASRHTRRFTMKEVVLHSGLECAHITATSEDTVMEIESPDRTGKATYRINTSGDIYFAVNEGFLVHTDIITAFSTTMGSTIMEGSTRFTQELIDVVK